MGREAKARQAAETRIVLERGDYFELRALIRDVEAIELDAMKAAQVYRDRREAARQRSQTKFEALAKQHGFDPTKSYRWDDAACELIAE